MSDDGLLITARACAEGVELLGLQQITFGCSHAQPLTMTVAQRDALHQPFATLTETGAQQLMNSLWQCGLRPFGIEPCLPKCGVETQP